MQTVIHWSKVSERSLAGLATIDGRATCICQSCFHIDVKKIFFRDSSNLVMKSSSNYKKFCCVWIGSFWPFVAKVVTDFGNLLVQRQYALPNRIPQLTGEENAMPYMLCTRLLFWGRGVFSGISQVYYNYFLISLHVHCWQSIDFTESMLHIPCKLSAECIFSDRRGSISLYALVVSGVC